MCCSRNLPDRRSGLQMTPYNHADGTLWLKTQTLEAQGDIYKENRGELKLRAAQKLPVYTTESFGDVAIALSVASRLHVKET